MSAWVGTIGAGLLIAASAGTGGAAVKHPPAGPPAGGVEAAVAARPLVAIDAEPDTSLDRFLSGLSDSTDRYFGEATAPRDTAGLDSALAYRLGHPSPSPARTPLHLVAVPDFGFNRVDGPVWGGVVRMGAAVGPGALGGNLGWAAGPNRLLGEATYAKTWTWRGGNWLLSGRGGRATAWMDRTASDHGDRHIYLTTLRALFGGSDRNRYLRHDGWTASLERTSERWRASAGFRDMLESPLPVTATWSLTGGGADLRDNLPAAFGRAREARFEVAWAWPGVPVQTEVQHQTSGHAIGSDFEYRRTRAASAAAIGLGRHVTLVPQAAYGRVTGTPVPQASFYLGGSSTLRSLDGDALGGSGLAVGRLDLIGTDDVLALARLPHPAWLPLQLGAFLASGAVWGTDPYGGTGSPAGDWPRRDRWLSEAGVSVIYQPGLPDPDTLLRFDWARPLGPGGRESRFSFGYTRAIDLLRPIR